MSAHSSFARAAAAGGPSIITLKPETWNPDLTPCREGRWNTAAGWQPVHGPHLTPLHGVHARNKTGIVGISIGTQRTRRKDGTHRIDRFYWVNLGSASRKVNIARLGQAEALRQALLLRSAYETAVAARNATIRALRASQEPATCPPPTTSGNS